MADGVLNEHRARQHAVLRACGVDAVLVADPLIVEWLGLTGAVLVVLRNDRSEAVVPRRTGSAGAVGASDAIICTDGTDDIAVALHLLHGALTVGLDRESTRHERRLRREGGHRTADVSVALSRVRVPKSDREMQSLRVAAARADDMMAAAARAAPGGAELVAVAVALAGGRDAPRPIVRVLDGAMHVEVTGVADGYRVSLARTIVDRVGRDDDDVNALAVEHLAVRDAVRAGIDALRPGARCGDVHAAIELALVRASAPDAVAGGSFGIGADGALIIRRGSVEVVPPWAAVALVVRGQLVSADEAVIVKPTGQPERLSRTPLALLSAGLPTRMQPIPDRPDWRVGVTEFRPTGASTDTANRAGAERSAPARLALITAADGERACLLGAACRALRDRSATPVEVAEVGATALLPNGATHVVVSAALAAACANWLADMDADTRPRMIVAEHASFARLMAAAEGRPTDQPDWPVVAARANGFIALGDEWIGLTDPWDDSACLAPPPGHPDVLAAVDAVFGVGPASVVGLLA